MLKRVFALKINCRLNSMNTPSSFVPSSKLRVKINFLVTRKVNFSTNAQLNIVIAVNSSRKNKVETFLQIYVNSIG